MARITIEDCVEKVPNRFHLVQMTAIRAKQLKKGATALVRAEENKAVVTALREIAAGLVSPDYTGEVPSTEEAAVSELEPTLGEPPATGATEELALSEGPDVGAGEEAKNEQAGGMG